MYDARVVANEILRQAWQHDYELTQLDIQKITYFMNGHHLIDHGTPMVKTDFEAWQFGPVQKVLYDAFRRFEDEPITQLATAFDPIRRRNKELPEITSNSVTETIAKYLHKYVEIPAQELVGLTHRRGTPWQRTIEAALTSANLGMRISNSLIAEHFEGLKA
jgi:uncharacterized phage-associated protein